MTAVLSIIIKLFGSLILQLAFRLATSIVGKLAEAITKIAQAVVAEINEESLSSEEKRAKAFRIIKERALSEGLAVKDFLINLAIELAVAGLKTAADRVSEITTHETR